LNDSTNASETVNHGHSHASMKMHEMKTKPTFQGQELMQRSLAQLAKMLGQFLGLKTKAQRLGAK
tara:strand:- start:276 stop:470 length:195 start_codon:yes stop_codon:yes gene_type:complete